MARSDYTGVPDVSPQIEAPNDYQHIEASPNAFGAQVAQGIQQVGAGAIDASKFYGQVAADNGTNNTLQQVTNILHGDPSKTVMGPDGTPVPDTGYFGKRGADALSARPEVAKEIDDIISQNRESLSTPESQLQYDNETRRYRAQWQTQIGSHADDQQRVWATDTNNTSAQLALNAVGMAPSDPDAVAQQQEKVNKAYVRNAQIKGEDPQGALLKARQDVALTQIRSLSVSDPAAAKQVLDQKTDVLASLPNYDGIVRSVKEAVINHQIGPATNAAVEDAKDVARTRVGNPAAPQGSGAALSEDQAAAAVRSAFPGATVTSQQRTPQHNAEVGGVPDSQHLSGNAIDFVLPKGTTFEQVKQAMVSHGLPTSELIDEGTHVHWAWGQKGAQQGQVYPSMTDALRGTEDATLTKAQADAVKMFPDYPDAQERYVQGVRRGLDQTIAQQDQQTIVDTHIVEQALASNHAPISEQQLISMSPQIAQSWRSMQVNNPLAAMHIENVFDANAKGRAVNLGTQFNTMMQRVLAPVGDPSRISNPSQLWPYTKAGESGPLTNTGLGRLSDMLSARQGPQGEAEATQLRTFFEDAHKMLSAQVPEMGFYDPKGEARYEKWMIQALPAIEAEKQGGKPLSQILAPKGDLYNSIFTFKRQPGQDLTDRILDTNRVNLGGLTGDKVVLDPARSAAVDTAITSKQFTPEQGAQIKALMLDVQTHKMTPAQAKARAQALHLFPPEVPRPTTGP